MMNDEYQSMAANAICHAAEMTKVAMEIAIGHYITPSVIWKPRLSIEGNQWCALYGDNLQDGVAGFGDSPEIAMWDFDKAWSAKMPAPKPEDKTE